MSKGSNTLCGVYHRIRGLQHHRFKLGTTSCNVSTEVSSINVWPDNSIRRWPDEVAADDIFQIGHDLTAVWYPKSVGGGYLATAMGTM